MICLQSNYVVMPPRGWMFGCKLTAGGGSPFCHLEERQGSEHLQPHQPPATGDFTPQAGVKHSVVLGF